MISRRHVISSLLATGALARSEPGAAAPKAAFERGDSSLTLKWDKTPLTTYVFRDPDVPRPYFGPLRTLDGLQVTRNYPPIEGQDPTDHGTFHPGLWLAFGDLSGQDFWRNKARVVHDRFSAEPIAEDKRASFSARSHYESSEGKLLGFEHAHYTVRQMKNLGWLLDWELLFSPVEPLVFGDQEEMGVGVRVATPLTVKNGGQILNSAGQKNEKEVWGQTADWCAYSGTLQGRQAGVLLMGHPKNFRRSWFHARDYGLLVANPFGRNAFTRGERSSVEVKPGDTLELRFGVLVFSAPAGSKIDFGKVFSEYCGG